MGCYWRQCGISNKMLRERDQTVTFIVDSKDRINTLPLFGEVIDDYGNIELTNDNDSGYIGFLKKIYNIEENHLLSGFDDIYRDLKDGEKLLDGYGPLDQHGYVYLWHIHRDIYDTIVDVVGDDEIYVNDGEGFVKRVDYYNRAIETLVEYFNQDIDALDDVQFMFWTINPAAAISLYRGKNLLNHPLEDTLFLEITHASTKGHMHNICTLWEEEGRTCVNDPQLASRKVIEFVIFTAGMDIMNIRTKHISSGHQTEYTELHLKLANKVQELFQKELDSLSSI